MLKQPEPVKEKSQTGPRFFILLLLITAVAVFVVVLRPDAGEYSESINPAPNQDQNSEITTEPETDSATGSLEGEVESVAATPKSRKVQVFLDKNKNNTWDSGDEACNVCIAKVLLTANKKNGLLPRNEEIREVTIGAQGLLNEADFQNVNNTWAYFDDRKLLIPEQTVALNDGSSDLFLQALPVSISLNAVNANISKVTPEGNDSQGVKVMYGFAMLVPVFQQASAQGQEIWVQLTPDPETPNKHYLTKGKLRKDTTGVHSGSADGYFLEVVWPVDSQTTGITKSENLRFFLI